MKPCTYSYEKGRRKAQQRGAKSGFGSGTKSESFNGRRVAAAGEVMRGTIHRCPLLPPPSVGRRGRGGRGGSLLFWLAGEDVKSIPGFRRTALARSLGIIVRVGSVGWIECARGEEDRLWGYYGAIKLNPRQNGGSLARLGDTATYQPKWELEPENGTQRRLGRKK